MTKAYIIKLNDKEITLDELMSFDEIDIVWLFGNKYLYVDDLVNEDSEDVITIEEIEV